MEWNEYKKLSEKTLSTEFHCGKQTENLLHGVIGILTELDELFSWNDEVNKKEEVADVFWYLALLDREMNLDLKIPQIKNEYTQLTNESLITKTISVTCLLLDDLKKKLYYNKQIPFDIFSTRSKTVFENMCAFCHHNDINIQSILDRNIDKLKARYGEKFSSDKAINRNLEIERLILEK
jgi:hypothetical protein